MAKIFFTLISFPEMLRNFSELNDPRALGWVSSSALPLTLAFSLGRPGIIWRPEGGAKYALA